MQSHVRRHRRQLRLTCWETLLKKENIYARLYLNFITFYIRCGCSEIVIHVSLHTFDPNRIDHIDCAPDAEKWRNYVCRLKLQRGNGHQPPLDRLICLNTSESGARVLHRENREVNKLDHVWTHPHHTFLLLHSSERARARVLAMVITD